MELATAEALAQLIDHTCLKPEASHVDIERLCQEALKFRFHTVCVNGSRVPLAYSLLEDTAVKVCSVVGFPLGAADTDTKRFETESAVDNGAQEIDVVVNIGWLKDCQNEFVVRELRDIVEAADERPVKVILETCLLTTEEKQRGCRLVLDSGAAFVKTSTGFSSQGAVAEDVALFRSIVRDQCGIKASGGIRNLEAALKMVKAGANRLGTSSSIAMVSELVALKQAKA